jgi:hypothetical protein
MLEGISLDAELILWRRVSYRRYRPDVTLMDLGW